MKVFDFPQLSAEWYQVRRGIPTASEMGNLITPKQGKLAAAAETYIHQLVGDTFDTTYGQVESYASPAMRRGTEAEPEARAWYEMERGDVRQVGFCLSDDGHFGCSPDGLVGENGGMELKCPSAKIHVGYLLNGGLPDDYRAQVHGSLIVTGREWWDFVSYVPGLPPCIVRTTPDDYTKKLTAALAEFWDRYMIALAKIRNL